MVFFDMLSCLFPVSWERADLLAGLCDVISCVIVTFPYGVLGHYVFGICVLSLVL